MSRFYDALIRGTPITANARRPFLQAQAISAENNADIVMGSLTAVKNPELAQKAAQQYLNESARIRSQIRIEELAEKSGAILNFNR